MIRTCYYYTVYYYYYSYCYHFLGLGSPTPWPKGITLGESQEASGIAFIARLLFRTDVPEACEFELWPILASRAQALRDYRELLVFDVLRSRRLLIRSPSLRDLRVKGRLRDRLASDREA